MWSLKTACSGAAHREQFFCKRSARKRVTVISEYSGIAFARTASFSSIIRIFIAKERKPGHGLAFFNEVTMCSARRLDIFGSDSGDIEGAILTHITIFSDVDEKAVIWHEIAVELTMAIDEVNFCDLCLSSDIIRDVAQVSSLFEKRFGFLYADDRVIAAVLRKIRGMDPDDPQLSFIIAMEGG